MARAWRSRRLPGGGSVASQILLLQLVVVLAVVAGALVLAYLDARNDEHTKAAQRVGAVATSVAASTLIPAALRVTDPSATLQPYAEQVRLATGTDFVVIMRPDGTRLTHPNPAEIGGIYLGSRSQALAGQTYVEDYPGTLGLSVRAITPVRDGGGAIVALVSVGIVTGKVQQGLLADLPVIVLAAVGVGVLGAVGTWLISRRLRRQTQGLAERDIAQMYEYYDGVLHAVREGMVLFDRDGRVLLINDEARRLLDLTGDLTDRTLATLGLPEAFVAAADGGRTLHDEVQLVGARMLVLNRTAAVRDGRLLGSVLTIRDRTELQAVTGELASVRSLADSLRSQNHEAANRLHAVVSLIEMDRPDDAVRFATQELDVAQRLTDRVVSAVDDPVIAAVLLGKTAQAAERGVELVIDPASAVGEHSVDDGDVVTLVGNLIDNAIDAVADRPPPQQVRVLVRAEGPRLTLRVADSGPGVELALRQQAFERGWSTKAGGGLRGRGIGLALVAATARSYGGSVRISDSDLGGAEVAVEIGESR